MRKEIKIFGQYMEHKLKLNDHKGGWDGKSIDFLLAKLEAEVIELRAAVRSEPNLNIMFEAADVANFAMMIAWNVMKAQVEGFVSLPEDETARIKSEHPAEFCGVCARTTHSCVFCPRLDTPKHHDAVTNPNCPWPKGECDCIPF